jgi:hypothetical protein
MLRPAAVRVKAIACLALAMLGACFWHSYAPRMRTYADVMVSIAHKGADLVRTGRFTAESMPELTYPLERAEAFAREVRGHAGAEPPASLLAFETLIARYRSFVDALDRSRREQLPEDMAVTLAEPLKAVDDAASAVDRALRREG